MICVSFEIQTSLHCNVPKVCLSVIPSVSSRRSFGVTNAADSRTSGDGKTLPPGLVSPVNDGNLYPLRSLTFSTLPQTYACLPGSNVTVSKVKRATYCFVLFETAQLANDFMDAYNNHPLREFTGSVFSVQD